MINHENNSIPLWLWLVFAMVLLISVVIPWIVVLLKAYLQHCREIMEKEEYIKTRIETFCKEQGYDLKWEDFKLLDKGIATKLKDEMK